MESDVPQSLKDAQDRVKEERGNLYKPLETFSSTQEKIEQLRYIKKLENEVKEKDAQLKALGDKEVNEKRELDNALKVLNNLNPTK